MEGGHPQRAQPVVAVFSRQKLACVFSLFCTMPVSGKVRREVLVFVPYGILTALSSDGLGTKLRWDCTGCWTHFVWSWGIWFQMAQGSEIRVFQCTFVSTGSSVKCTDDSASNTWLHKVVWCSLLKNVESTFFLSFESGSPAWMVIKAALILWRSPLNWCVLCAFCQEVAFSLI